MIEKAAHSIRRFFRSPNTQGVAKLILEGLVFVILAWLLYHTLSRQGPALALPTKHMQLLIATLASGALVHAWRRWTGQNTGRPPSTTLLSWCKFFNVPLWLAWLGLGVLGWGAFGQDRLWDLNRPLWILKASPYQEAKVEGEEIISTYLTVVGVIIAVITGYYLVILHRVTDRAETTLEFLRDRYEERLNELENLIGKEEESTDELAAREMHLRNQVLIPMLTELRFLGGPENLKKLTRWLQAETALFNLSKVDTASQFMTAWDDVQAYQGVFREDLRAFRHLFQIGQRNLESLFEKGLASRDDERLTKAADDLYEYARQSNQ